MPILIFTTKQGKVVAVYVKTINDSNSDKNNPG